MKKTHNKKAKLRCRGSFTGCMHAIGNGAAATHNVKKSFTKTNNAYRYRLHSSPLPPPHTADLGTDEKAAVFENRRYWESYNITFKRTLFGTWKWAPVLGGAVLGGGGGGGP